MDASLGVPSVPYDKPKSKPSELGELVLKAWLKAESS